MFPSWVTPIENLYSEDNRTLQKMAALEYIRSKWIISELCIPLPKPIIKLSKELVNWSRTYPHNNCYNCYDAYDLLDVVPEEKYDRQIMAIYHQLEKYIQIDRKLCKYSYSDKFSWYFLMKAKKIRLDYEYYMNIKNDINYIINSI
jgi:hypothetical protein